ncbi:MAG: class I SAM-dependent methyltransferase [Bacteroidota bacterium]
MIKLTSAFDQNALEYDQWFDKHKALYQSELAAVEKAIPKSKTGIEIGTGTGRFAQPFNIRFGVEPSENMAQLAEQRGMKIYRASAENLPLENSSFDFAIMVTTVCFLENIPKAFSEVHRILKPNGEIILGIIDKNSSLGKKYQQKKLSNKFYRDAHFHSTEEIASLLKNSRFNNFQYWQTLTQTSEKEIEKPQQGFGKGSFVVIKAIRI